ncbi:hypothetical protein ACJX0J_040154 [Zea mays]
MAVVAAKSTLREIHSSPSGWMATLLIIIVTIPRRVLNMYLYFKLRSKIENNDEFKFWCIIHSALELLTFLSIELKPVLNSFLFYLDLLYNTRQSKTNFVISAIFMDLEGILGYI